MFYAKIFKGKMAGPFRFSYSNNSGIKLKRICYIINSYNSGLYNVFCPETKREEGIYIAEFSLAIKIENKEGESFVAVGYDNYLNIKI